MTSFYREKADPKFCIPESYQKQPEEKEEKEDEINLEWLEGAAILFAVVLVVVITAFNDWTKGPGFNLTTSSGHPGTGPKADDKSRCEKSNFAVFRLKLNKNKTLL